MQHVTLETVVPFSCAEAFNAASAFREYPAYFPVIKGVEIREQGRNTAKIKFGFDRDSDLFPPYVKPFLRSMKDLSQTSRITLKPGQEISGHGIFGILKKVDIKCRFNAESADRTRVKFDLQFETGYGRIVDWFAKQYIEGQAPVIVENLEDGVRAYVTRQKTGASPG